MNGRQISEERIEQNKQTLIYYLSCSKREGIDKLIEWLQTTNFFTTPASVSYHLNIRGGLVQHSLNVMEAFLNIQSSFTSDFLDSSSVYITTLLHDLCKHDLYKECNGSYTYNNPPDTRHGQKSVELIKRFINLTEKEELMIRWHMAHYVGPLEFDLIKNTITLKHPEVHLIYFADHLASLYLDTRKYD